MKLIRPSELLIFMTEQCNLRCKYCFETGSFKDTYISNEILQKALDMLMESNDGYEGRILLFGGEPTLNKVGMEYLIDKYIEYKQNGNKNIIHFGINTNFYHVDDDVERILGKYILNTDFHLGISMDATKSAHDLCRRTAGGQPTYDRIIENVKRFRKLFGNKVYINFHSVIYKDALDHIEEIAESVIYNLKSGLCNSATTSYTTPNTTPEELDADDFDKVYKAYFEKYINDTRLCLDKWAEFWGGLVPMVMSDSPYRVNTCKAGYENFAIMCNGDIKVCHKYKMSDDKKHLIHNILDYDDNYIHIEDKSRFNEYLDRENRIDNKLITVRSELGHNCMECKLASNCHGCIGRAELSAGSIYKRSKEMCMRTITLAEVSMKYEMVKLERERLAELKKQNELMEKLSDSMVANLDLTVINHNMLCDLESKKEGE